MTPFARTIACSTIAFAAWIAQDTSGPPREVQITVTEGTSMAAAVSPDHLWIATDLLGSLWLVPFHGGEAKKITPDTLEARLPTWAPDSQALAFQGFGDDGAWHIYTIGFHGESLRQITNGLFDEREPDWSHDGTRILFSSDRGGGLPAIWEVMPTSGALRRITSRSGANPCWAPSDKAIAFVSRTERSEESGIWMIDDQGRERRIAAWPETGSVGSPSWNPDGDAVAFVRSDELGVRLIAGQIVTRFEDVFPFKPQWLSRNEVLYTADGHIKRRSVRGLAQVIPFHAKVSLTHQTVTAVHRVLEPSEPQRLAGIVSPAVSPDGTKVAFAALGDLWVMPIGEHPMRVTDDPFVELDPAWSPDGFKIAFASDRNGNMDLWVHDVRARIAVPIRKEENAEGDLQGRVSGIAWSPDGTQIGYLLNRAGVLSTPAPGELASCHKTPSVVRSFYNDLGRMTWGPDNCTVAMGALFPYGGRGRPGINQTLLYAFDRGLFSSDLLFPEHSVGDRRNNGPVWAPDGLKMAFVSEGKLWVVPVDPGGKPTDAPRPIAEDFPDAPSWQGDSRRLVYLTPSGLRRVSAEGGLSQPIAVDLGWAPSRPPRRVVVHAGELFDGRNQFLRSQTDLVIEHGIIVDVSPHADDLHGGAVVDAGDETVMPGFIDARTHLDPTYGEVLGRIWLAYGVTSVRDVSLNPYVGLEQREAIANGRRIGPRVFIAGDPFDGVRIRDAGGVPIGSEPQLDAALARATLLGVDFLTLRGRLGSRLESRLVDYAHAHGLRMTTTHLFPAMVFGFDDLNLPLHHPYRDVIDVLAKSGLAWTPTLATHLGFEASIEKDRTILRDPRLSLFPPAIAARYRAMAAAKGGTMGLEAAYKPYRDTVKAIVSAGGRVVAGTDAPSLADVPYGLSLHVELEQLVASGMSPFQALQAATLYAAEALGVSDELGTIEPGKVADLVFLGGDPLQDIRRTRDVRRVMRGGRIYDATTLRIPQ